MNQNLTQLINSNSNLWQYAQKMGGGKSQDQIRQIAMNLCKEKGISYEEVFAQFQQLLNMK